MKKRHYSFPKSVIFLIFYSYLLLSCQKKDDEVIDKQDFIDIYSKILIINEMNIDKENQTQLVLRIYKQYDINESNIVKTVNYFNENPEEWIDITEQVRNLIKNMKNDSLFLIADEDTIKILE